MGNKQKHSLQQNVNQYRPKASLRNQSTENLEFRHDLDFSKPNKSNAQNPTDDNNQK